MSSHKLLHAIVSGVYALSYTLVSYTLGLMQSSEYYVDEFPVWAVCLLLLLGRTDSLAACSLSDIDNWKSFYVKHLVKGVLVVYIIVTVVYLPKDSESRYLQAPLWAILFVMVLQSYARLTSMRMASKSHLLCQNVKLIADYMQHQEQLPSSPTALNPITMEGYPYVVGGERRKKYRPGSMLRYKEEDYAQTTTVEHIWQCTGSLLCSDPKKGLQLKDVCLSMALSKLLNRRFAGFPLAEAGLDKTRDFVFQGLLAGGRPYERAFRVIEVELAFVHDWYYTTYPYLYHKGRFFALCLPLAMVILCSWLTYELFAHMQLLKKNEHHSDIYLYTTLILMAGVTFLEVFQLYLHMASGWLKVALIRSYVTRPVLQRGGRLFHMIIRVLLSLKTLQPWEDKLGQYSLLDKFDRRSNNCLHYVTLCLVDKRRKGRKRGKLLKLPEQVKQAVIDSLLESNGHLTNGARSLRKNGVHEQLSWACAAGNGMATYTMLVWHIATTFCKQQLDQHPEDKKLIALSKEDTRLVDTYLVATSLSEYCAYLIAFAPNLLPDHSADSALILSETIAEACNSLAGANTMEAKCKKLMSLVADHHHAGDDAHASVVVLGGRLARQLTDEIEGPVLRWKVLSDFWAEMMLYVAPCDDARARAHLEAMARGGEFITHLWALLTHAGVLDRGPVGPLAAV
ncbi:hypothetical protein ACQJBY_063197 [Aegilops geniculata]